MIAWLKLAVIWCCNEAIAFKVGTWKDEPVSSEEPAEDPESEVYVNASLNASTPAQKIVDAVDRNWLGYGPEDSVPAVSGDSEKGIRVTIGSNQPRRRISPKCVPAPVPNLDCNSFAGNPPYRVKAGKWNDHFEIYKSGDNICARRTDKNDPWGLHLEIDCKVGTEHPRRRTSSRRWR
ncbi:unnamed protein product, partial [Symbiodinium natans]